MKSYLNLYVLGLTLSLSANVLAQGKSVRVVTYIDDVQEERRSTRWTLTEWLRIKERMKMMDVWLAMFSDPKKDKFAPELSLTYTKGRGTSELLAGSADNFVADREGSDPKHLLEGGRAQFWFTNLVSSTTGLRTLDIDIGLEGQVSKRLFDHDQELMHPLSGAFALTSDKLEAAGVNLRIFGASSQDSTLVAKFGRFEKNNGIDLEGLKKSKGQYAGGEMSLYFMKWLGAEGHYLQFKPQAEGLWRAKGTHYEYSGFLEIYNLRLGYGLYGRDWSFTSDEARIDSQEKGKAFFVRLHF